MKEQILKFLTEQRTDNTKNIAKYFNISTSKAYSILCGLLLENKVSKYGYEIKPGEYEDPEYSNHHFKSLIWQINE